MVDIPDKNLLAPGHRGCAGCGASIAVKLALNALGENTVAISATGCLEVMTTPYPETAWEVPFIHVAFENSGAVASGVESALRIQGKEDVNVIAFGGDGGTVDIGLQSLSGAMERGHNMTYICYDNEAYMNTGIQRSGATPFGATTTTSRISRHSSRRRSSRTDALWRRPGATSRRTRPRALRSVRDTAFSARSARRTAFLPDGRAGSCRLPSDLTWRSSRASRRFRTSR